MKTPPAIVALAVSLALVSAALETPTVRAFSSVEATLVEFTFNGELYVSTPPASRSRTIQDQLQYTIGQLNGDRAVGRLPAARLSNVRSAVVGGSTRIRYRAVLPVAWGLSEVPSTYILRLPRRVDDAGLQAFTNRYRGSCVDFGSHDVKVGSMWYYYRPLRPGCVLRPADVVNVPATIQTSEENTVAKYPEFDQIWNDDALDVLVVFAKYEARSTTPADAGIAAYNQFSAGMRTLLGPDALTVPAFVPANPGVLAPDIVFSRTIGGKRTTVTMLLVDSVASAGAAFDARYGSLSRGADLIIYNGHAGLGGHIRVLAQKATFVPGKYLIFFMNAPDSFAYGDRSLAQRRAVLNPGDPGGTRYMDMVTNAMPAFFASMPSASLAMIRGLMDPTAAVTYDEMLRGVDAQQVALVTGEEDNTYTGNAGDGTVTEWAGMKASASVVRGEERVYQTPVLGAGHYTFTMTHDPAHAGGDADLYVRIGQQPTPTAYDCRPYRSGSDEACEVQITTPTRVFAMVRGYADRGSYFVLEGRR